MSQVNGHSFAEVARQHAEQHEEEQHQQEQAAPVEPGFSSDTADNKPNLADLMQYAQNAGEDEFPALGSGPAQTEDDEEVEISSDDVLGSALSSAFSFSAPPPAPTPASPPTESAAELPPMPNAAFPDTSQPPRAGESVNPDPRPDHTGPVGPDSPEELDMWKAEYEQQQRDWKAESHLMREKAERVRGDWLKIREEEEKSGKAQAMRMEAERKRMDEEERVRKEEKKIGGEVGGKSGSVAKELGLEGSAVELASKGVEGAKVGEDEAKWRKAEQAWKGVQKEKAANETGNQTESDLRMVDGLTVETIVSGIAADPNPSSSTTIEPTLKGVPSAVGHMYTDANHIVDPSSSSKSSKPSSSESAPEQNPTGSADLPISAYLTSSTSSSSTPPSLTLALFSSKYLPLRRRVLLGFACLGINILLPFVGGMMAGFGEITAKSVQAAMRDAWFGTRGAGSVADVGLGSRSLERKALKENPMREAFP